MEIEKNDTLSKAESNVLARAIAYILLEKKALDVRIYNVSENSSVTNFYVNATGRSSTNVGALGDEVVYKVGLCGRDEMRVEGRSANSWLLIDYGDVIVNIFDKESREFYNFDRLLPVEGRVDVSDIIEELDRKYDINKKEN